MENKIINSLVLEREQLLYVHGAAIRSMVNIVHVHEDLFQLHLSHTANQSRA